MAIPDEWHRLEEEGLWIPVRAVPKERPQVGSKGAYYSDRYVEFRRSVGMALATTRTLASGIDFPVSLECSFGSDGFHMQLRRIVSWQSGEVRRPTHVRGDIDNMMGGVMDALQDHGVLADDKWILETHTRLWEDIDGDEEAE